MQVQLISEVSEFEALAGEWDALLERAVVPSLFLSWVWQRTWWQYLGNGQLALITVRDDAGNLVGIAPLFRQTADGLHELSLVGCVDVSDYLDLIVDGCCVEPVYRAVWDFLSGPHAPSWDEINLCNLPHSSPTPAILGGLAEAAGYPSSASVGEVCPVITLPATFDEYLASLDKKQRHEIRRKARRIQEAAQVRWYVVEGGETLAADIEAFIDLHQRSTVEKEGFWDEAMKAFFRAMTARMAARGWLKLCFIELNGIRAAALLCFDYRNEMLVYNSGYDPANFAHLSPGNVLVGYCIEHAIQLGRTRFDFLRGDEEYKFRFGAQPEPIHHLRIRRPV